MPTCRGWSSRRAGRFRSRLAVRMNGPRATLEERLRELERLGRDADELSRASSKQDGAGEDRAAHTTRVRAREARRRHGEQLVSLIRDCAVLLEPGRRESFERLDASMDEGARRILSALEERGQREGDPVWLWKMVERLREAYGTA